MPTIIKSGALIYTQTPGMDDACLDDDIGHPHLLAEGREPDDQLDGVHIMGDDYELCLPILHQSGDVVDAILDDDRLLLVYSLSALSGLGLLHEALLHSSEA